MSETETATHEYFLAKDGKVYNTYTELVEANKRRNEEHIKMLGLHTFVKETKSPVVKKKKRQKVVTPEEVRRSSRVKRVTPEFVALPDNFVEPRKKKRKVESSSRKIELSEGDRAKLRDLPDWLDDMEDFLLAVPHGKGNKVVSRDNARTVMRQVKKMVSGIGIDYHHWEEGVIFEKDVCIDLSMDMDALHDKAVAFETDHGRDLGNGWLMRHAIRKMQCYQEYLAERQCA